MKPLRTLFVLAIVLSLTGVALCGTERPRPVNGPLVKVDGANLVVSVRQQGGDTKDVTIVTTDETKYLVDAEAGKLADLKVGMRLMITLVQGTTDKAARVVANSRGLSGQVVKVDGTNVVLRVRQGEETKEVTVATDDKTKVFLPGEGRGADPKPGTLADLKPNMRVTVLPETGTAAKIIVSAMGGGRRAGGGGGGGGN